MFSAEVLDKIQAEADALGLKGATAISVALREQLNERKKTGKTPDDRMQTYYVAGRGVDRGVSRPVPHAASATGFAEVEQLASDLAVYCYGEEFRIPTGFLKDQVKAARVNLSRKGSAHLQAVLESSFEGGNALRWVDLWVYLDQAAAEKHAAELPSGKVF